MIGPVADLAKSILEKIWPPQADPNLKAQAEAQLAIMLEQRENAVVNAQREIMVAEMQQGDNYTKRARPTLVYSGLFFIFLVHVVFPMVSWFTKNQLPALALPNDFWWAWGSVVAIWSVGRTVERRGTEGRLGAIAGAITGK
jgi:hypothetical protein